MPAASASRLACRLGLALAAFVLAVLAATPAEARTRTFCGVMQRSRGGHLHG